MHRLLVTVLATLLCASTSFAQGSSSLVEPSHSPEVEAKAGEIFGEVLSPFCPGRMLADCPSGNASQLKEKIREDLSGGKDREEILDELYAVYGSSIRAAPTTEGFGWFAWITPFAFLIFGGIILSIWLKRRSVRVEGEEQADFL